MVEGRATVNQKYETDAPFFQFIMASKRLGKKIMSMFLIWSMVIAIHFNFSFYCDSNSKEVWKFYKSCFCFENSIMNSFVKFKRYFLWLTCSQAIQLLVSSTNFNISDRYVNYSFNYQIFVTTIVTKDWFMYNWEKYPSQLYSI